MIRKKKLNQLFHLQVPTADQRKSLKTQIPPHLVNQGIKNLKHPKSLSAKLRETETNNLNKMNLGGSGDIGLNLLQSGFALILVCPGWFLVD